MDEEGLHARNMMTGIFLVIVIYFANPQIKTKDVINIEAIQPSDFLFVAAFNIHA